MDESTPTITPRYNLLRWAIRITGIVLMLGGTIYLGVTASQLLTSGNSGNELLFLIVCSVIALGMGILVIRAGYAMLRSINSGTISSFSFVFSLVYTFIVAQILPSTGFAAGHPILLYALVFLYFVLSYLILKSILLHLLMPRKER
jgi:hypothetical protein